jgi:hypothetical protein
MSSARGSSTVSPTGNHSNRKPSHHLSSREILLVSDEASQSNADASAAASTQVAAKDYSGSNDGIISSAPPADAFEFGFRLLNNELKWLIVILSSLGK